MMLLMYLFFDYLRTSVFSKYEKEGVSCRLIPSSPMITVPIVCIKRDFPRFTDLREKFVKRIGLSEETNFWISYTILCL